MLLATVPAAPPTRKNQRATSWPAPISAMVPYLPLSRLSASAFCRVPVGCASTPPIVRDPLRLCNAARACVPTISVCRQSPGVGGGVPPPDTLSRIPLGHSGPPRDIGFGLRESPQKTRVRGGNPPPPPGARVHRSTDREQMLWRRWG